MLARLWYTVLFLCALGAAHAAESGEMTLSLGGTAIGKNTYTWSEDGIVQSKTTASVAGTDVLSEVTAKITDGKLVRLKLTQTVAKVKVEIELDGLKAKGTSGGRTSEITLKEAPTRIFSNYHPQLLRTLFAGTDPTKGKQSLEVFVIDSGANAPCTVEPKPNKVIKVGDKPVELLAWAVSLGAVTIDYYQRADKTAIVGMGVPTQMFDAVLTGFEGVFVDPTSAYPELSQPGFKSKVEKGVPMKTRDGVELVADIALPDTPGKYPTILVRTPYGRATQFVGNRAEWWAKRGYVFIVQDTRGRHDSGGEWDPFMYERKDGYDTIDWISKQPWSDGKVGMIGGSYMGGVQWQAAVEQHPALKCIVPQVSPPDPMFNLPFDGGAFFLWGSLWWTNLVKEKVSQMELAGQPLPNIQKIGTLPLSKVDDAVLGRNVPFFDKWLERDTLEAWKGWAYQDDLKNVRIPALHVSGWWDGDGIGTKTNWAKMAQLGRTNQWLIYGPWPHAFNSTSKVGGVDYGPQAILELDSVFLRWFDQWLKNKPVGFEKTPKVQVFVTGVNEWRSLDAWPSAKSPEKTWYLSAPGPANGDTSLGELVDKPAEEQEASRYIFNPADARLDEAFTSAQDPNASMAIKIDPADESTLVFKTSPMKEALEIGGPITVDLHFSTTAKDTDFFAVLVDIDEKGTIWPVAMPGKITARYLAGWNKPAPLTPGKVYRASFDIWDTAHRFLPGHRAGLLISSGLFPLAARNLGTGEAVKSATRMVVQANTIFHDAKRPSSIRFRVLPPK